MRCPKCGCQDDKVIDSRASREGATIRRRRECTKCAYRYTTYEQIDDLVDQIVDDLSNSYDREVPCQAIGERVMAGLRGLDPVAYVRYASLYRRFEEATDFVQEVKKLEKPYDTLTARLPGI